MSIHVTVNGNPVYRRKLLLTDIETAKKNEWQRRRKIRLQQARQQAKDLAQNVRKKVSSEKISVEKYEEEKDSSEQNKRRKEKMDSLQREYEHCLSSVGSGHHLAALQNECEVLQREKQELREEIARARGAIAEEKLRADKFLQKEKALAATGRIQLSRKVETLRSNLISKLPSVKSTCTFGAKSNIKVKAQVHRDPDSDEHEHSEKKASENRSKSKESTDKVSKISGEESQQSQRKKSTLSDCEDLSEESDDDSDVTWPPRSAKVVKESIPSPRVRFYDHRTRTSKEWQKPPYTITHMDPSNQPDMSEIIAEEEEAYVRKENLDTLARREKMIRGSRALRKEREKKEAERIIREIDDLEKRRKIQMIINRSYPSHFHSREPCRDQDSEKTNGRLCCSAQDEVNEGVRLKKIPVQKVPQNYYSRIIESGPERFEREAAPPQPFFSGRTDNADSEEILEDLIHKLKEERAKKQSTLENRFGVKGIEEVDIPSWMPKPSQIQPSGIDRSFRSSPERCLPVQKQSEKSPDKPKSQTNQNRSIGIQNVPNTPTKCACSSKCNCFKEDLKDPITQETVEEKINISPILVKGTFNEEKHEDDPLEKVPNEHIEDLRGQTLEETAFQSEEEKLLEKTPKMSIQSQETISTGSSDSTSLADTLESSLTYEGVKVVVKVSEKNRKRKVKSPIKIRTRDKDVQTSIQDSGTKNASWNSHILNGGTSTSTSYLSPPSRLSPAHQSLIRSILKKIETRNKNPRLHAYIQRLLDMSHESIEKLPVSSVSDISISSSIFDRNESILKTMDQQRYDACCQAGSSLDESSHQEEALKFSELAKCYADRVNDLAGMIDALRLMPMGGRPSLDDTSYINPPEDVHHSLKLSNSLKSGTYPRPLDISDFPTSIEPHPSHLQPQLHNGFPRRVMEDMPRNLSTIQESETIVEKEAEILRGFDPDVSSIRGTPQKNRTEKENGRSSTGSSLCLLDEKDISSFLGSSSDDFEDVFRSLGIAWALPTVRKTRESRKLSCGSSTSSGRLMYSHSTPLGPSPVKGSAEKAGSSSAKQRSSKSEKVNTDSLTPPCLSLNIPCLCQHLSPSSDNKYK